VVLGGDTPLGLPLILGLESQGYIVIASVATPEAADELERKCHGFVRALVLDPREVGLRLSIFSAISNVNYCVAWDDTILLQVSYLNLIPALPTFCIR
jgi:hypothetical protein